MPNRCVVYGCDSTPNIDEGIALHNIPFFGDERPEAIKRRRLWIRFVQRKRDKWQPTKGSSVCSKHFRREDFCRLFFKVSGLDKPVIPRLKRDDIGVAVIPSIQPTVEPQVQEYINQRSRRASIRNIMRSDDTRISENCEQQASGEEEVEVAPVLQENSSILFPMDVDMEFEKADDFQVVDVEHWQHTEYTCTCERSRKTTPQNRVLRNKILNLRHRLKERVIEVKKLKRKAKINEKKTFAKGTQTSSTNDHEQPVPVPEEVTTCIAIDSDDEIDAEDDVSVYEAESEPETEEESDGGSDFTEGVTMQDSNLRTEPKYIVFLSQLLLLFKVCHICKADAPMIEVAESGTEVIVTATCKNEKCPKKDFVWHSQPTMPASAVSAGNFLLCMAILFAGSTASKVFRIFRHMGLRCISLNTFFKHQRTKLFPLIHIFWKRYQEVLINRVKELPGSVVVAGDGRHDSMGHSAKYGVYSILCSSLPDPKIIEFSLVQRNDAGSSNAIELMAFQECMNSLTALGVMMSTLVSDRHTGITSHMKTVLSEMKHYFDLWHLKKKIRKVLTKISKEKDCEEIKPWIKPAENHLYWSALSTFDGNGKIIWAKFKSFLSHIIDKHSNLNDPLFNACNHGDIEHRTWLDKDSKVYEKVEKALTNNSLQRGIMQASPLSQTSCLEGFHSCLNHFSPKMIQFSYAGMYCRQILAILHFNYNLQRDVKTRNKDGKDRIKVVYPKFKNGQATVRNVRVQQNFDYVDELFKTYCMLTKTDLNDAAQQLKDMTPESLTSSMEKESREDALERKDRRTTMAIHDVPPTTPVAQVEQQEREAQEAAQATSQKKERSCSSCHKPLKNHKTLYPNCERYQKK